jgi:hypothetical protein
MLVLGWLTVLLGVFAILWADDAFAKRGRLPGTPRNPLNRATSDAMFKIIAVVVIGIFGGIGFFDLGQEAYTLAALLLGIGALLDYGRKKAAG